MSAKEMFEKLGYEEREETFSMSCIKSYIHKGSFIHIIYFDYDKQIDIGNRPITFDLLQAINKQCEELGWLDVNTSN